MTTPFCLLRGSTPRFCLRAVVITAFAMLAVGEEIALAEPVDYVRDVKPVLTKHCSACHSPLRQKSGFRIDTAELLIRGGDMGPAVVPGKSGESPLIHAVLGLEGMSHMPPEGSGERLSPELVELLRRWIDEGAQAPVEPPAPDPRQHWSYQPVTRPQIPSVANEEWSRNPIDSFIAAEHEKLGLNPRPEAERHVLLRRVFLDLTGLPPTRDEMRTFLSDASPMAYENAVERLLRSPRYGERWGRHWMDVWRYSDWAGWGQQIRDSQPHIWHWRDWIIESLNADRPYDEMVVEMLAADELEPANSDKLRATGFLARNFKLLSREQWLQDTVEHTTKAFLGLTVNCARCHDHLTDPIDQVDYYRLRSVFEPHHVRLDRIPGIPDTTKDGIPRVFDKDPGAATFLFVRGDERNPDKNQTITPGVPGFLGGPEIKVTEVPLPRSSFEPERQDFVIRDDLAAGEQRVASTRKKLEDLKQKNADAEQISTAELELAVEDAKQTSFAATVAVEQLEASGDMASEAWAAAAKAAFHAQRQLAAVEARVAAASAKKELAKVASDLAEAKKAGDASKTESLTPKLAEAEKKVAEAESKVAAAEAATKQESTTAYAKRTVTTYPSTSTGRRLALARWIADSRNPLTARVAANHIWARHFDAALVPSVFNFGVSGEPPVNQPLLDWLAAELVDPQYSCCPAPPWTMKHLHRLIVTSKTYRMASTTDTANANIDPDNRYLWRAPTRRMEAEVVRDSAFHVAGQLDLTMGGPDISHDKGLSVKRRSVYFQHAAEKQMLFLKLFDCASVGECYERRESVIPQQALALANSELTLVQARLLARQLTHECGDDAAGFVVAAIEQVLAKPALPAELSVCLEFLSAQEKFFASNQPRLTDTASNLDDGQKPAADPRLRSREQLVHALINHNDFVTIR